jgi:hypothetical protein
MQAGGAGTGVMYSGREEANHFPTPGVVAAPETHGVTSVVALSVFGQVVILGIGATFGTAAFRFFEGALSFRSSGVAAQIEEKLTVDGIDAWNRLREMLPEQIMWRLSLIFAGIDAAQRLFGQFVASSLFTVGGNVPAQTRVLGTPLTIADLSDERLYQGRILLVKDFQFGIAGGRHGVRLLTTGYLANGR